MSVTSTTAPSDVLASSGMILNEGVVVLESGTYPANYSNVGNPYQMLPVFGSVASLTAPANNLPQIYLYLFLEGEYVDPLANTWVPQIDCTWQPLVGIKGLASGRPLAAPMILPVNTPIFYTFRSGLSNVGFNITAPTRQVATYNRIQYCISVSQ